MPGRGQGKGKGAERASKGPCGRWVGEASRDEKLEKEAGARSGPGHEEEDFGFVLSAGWEATGSFQSFVLLRSLWVTGEEEASWALQMRRGGGPASGEGTGDASDSGHISQAELAETFLASATPSSPSKDDKRGSQPSGGCAPLCSSASPA